MTRQANLFRARRLLSPPLLSDAPTGEPARRMVTLRSAPRGWAVELFVEWLAG
jgi:hypothetical protein